MRKFFVTALMLMIFGIGLPLTAEAHNGCRRHARKSYAGRTYATRTARYGQPAYSRRSYAYNKRPSFYRRHRNLINMAIGTGGGALVGGLVGGRKGAAIGALTGLGASALYTYKLNPKKRRYYRY